MFNNLEKYKTLSVMAVRFRPNFTLTDNLGNIVDNILFSSKSYFDSEFFPLVISTTTSRRLINEETGDELKILTDNIILTLQEIQFNKRKLKECEEAFEKQILKGVMNNQKIQQINRIGYINKYSIPDKAFAEEFVERTIGSFGRVDDFEMRFSKRLPLEEGLVKKGVNDYHNVIVIIERQKQSESFNISVDYQRYYDPFLEDFRLIKFTPFLKSVKEYNSNKLPKWLTENYGITINAA